VAPFVRILIALQHRIFHLFRASLPTWFAGVEENPGSSCNRENRNVSSPMSEQRPTSRQLTRNRIVEAAVAVMAESGLEGFSMRALGHRLGTTQMMPYRHFASKDALFVEIKRLVFDRFGAYLDECASSGRTPETRLRRHCLGYIKFGCEASADYELIFGRWSRSAYLAVLAADGIRSLNMTRGWSAALDIVAVLRDTTREDRHVIVACHTVWGALHGLVSLHLARKLGFGPTIHEIAPSVIENLLQIAGSKKAPKSGIRPVDLPPVQPVLSATAKRDRKQSSK
jgi:AcrR family transcriptional regulator